jgi:predicted SAM-dependent methyltransferase
MGTVTVTPLFLNIGSGQRPFQRPPFTNVDVQERWKPDVVADGVSYLSSLKDETVSINVLQHILEHAGCGENDNLLRQCYRTLRPSGSLLVFVPNMRELAVMWIEGRLTDQIYMTNVYGAYMGDEADRHKWGFTYATMRESLQKAGFSKHNIRPFDWRPVPGADLARDRWILAMEASK